MANDDDLFDLDEDVSQVEDLAQFVNPCDGTHLVGIIFAGTDKIGSEKKGVKIVYQLVETIEKAKEDVPCSARGSMFSESFTGNDMGRKLLKLRLKQIFGADIEGAFRPYVEALNSEFKGKYLVQLTTKVVISKGKKGTENEGNTYENLRIVDAKGVEATLPEKWEWAEYNPRTDD